MTAVDEGVLVELLDPVDLGVGLDEVGRIVAGLARIPPDAVLTLSGPGVEPVPIPTRLIPMVAAILSELGQGHTVAALTTAAEVSTGVAAQMLGFSRPHVAKLVDTGVLPGRKLNRHRRIRAADVMAFKREMERKLALLDELSALSQEMGLYDSQVFED